jgi:DNA-directed RNA polymerase specialized sigma24 family protein
MSLSMPDSRVAALLSDPAMRARVARVVQKRVADEQAAQDIVQNAFADAYAYESRLPKEDAAARKYLFGIVRNKIRMHIREWLTRSNEAFDEEIHGRMDPPPVEARWLLRKIVADVPESRWQTVGWFVRVALGDSLADIAREAGVDYDTAHKRYDRMREELRRRANELTTMVAMVLLAFGILRTARPHPDQTATPDLRPAPSYSVQHEPTPKEQAAAELRREAFAACDAHRWSECLQGFDEARRIDPSGDAALDVQAARKAAEDAVRAMRERPVHDVRDVK